MVLSYFCEKFTLPKRRVCMGNKIRFQACKYYVFNLYLNQSKVAQMAEQVATASHLIYCTTQLSYYQFDNQHYKLELHSTCVPVKLSPRVQAGQVPQ